jgi:hypothetical protein
MIQQIAVIILFAAALGYLGYRAWTTLRQPARGGCTKGCGCELPERSPATLQK